MELKYKPVIGIIMIVLGLLNLVLAILISSPLNVMIGLLVTGLGIMMLIRPIVSVSPNVILMKNALGMTLKRHSFTKNNFEVRDKKIFIDGKKRVSLRMLNTTEQEVRDYLTKR